MKNYWTEIYHVALKNDDINNSIHVQPVAVKHSVVMF
jgi:hypothetical protein